MTDDEADRYYDQWLVAKAQNKKLREKVARLTAALKPFAEVARVFDDDMRGSCMPMTGEFYGWPRLVNGELYTYKLTVEHLREARDATTD